MDSVSSVGHLRPDSINTQASGMPPSNSCAHSLHSDHASIPDTARSATHVASMYASMFIVLLW